MLDLNEVFRYPRARQIMPTAMLGLIVVLVVSSVVAAIFGGLAWMLYVAAAGTAAGTLGLAYSTWSLASETQDAGLAARADLEVAQESVVAATRTADEAERARVDAIAPLVDLSVGLSKAVYTPSEVGLEQLTSSRRISLGETLSRASNWKGPMSEPCLMSSWSIFGKTPAYFQFTHMGFLVNSAVED